MILSLSTELHDRLYQALLHCEEFNVNMRLEGELARYNSMVFDYPYNAKDEKGKKEELAERAIKYLVRQRIKREHLVLPLFLMVLYDTLGEDDELRYELEELHTLVVSELDEIVKSQAHTIVKATPTMESMLPPSPSSPLDLMNGVFLERADRAKIKQIAIEMFDAVKSDEGKKSLLRDVGLPDLLINTIKFEAATGNLVDEVIGYLERRDKQDLTMTCLERFVLDIVYMIYKGTEVENNMNEIIARYNNNRRVHASNEKDNRYHVRLKPEDYDTSQKLEALSRKYSNLPQVPTQKIDTAMLIRCNLIDQRTCFTTGFNKRFKGFFSFAIASVESTILRDYVLGGLLWELTHYNPLKTTVHHVYLHPEHGNSSNIEQGNSYIQQRIQECLSVKSLRDLLEDTQNHNIAVVLWTKNNLPPNFKDIALQFSETVKQEVSDILQNRCLILFWAKNGPIPLEPLDISGVLPTFEQFDVQHIIDWFDIWLSPELKAKNVPEQEIKDRSEELVKKIKPLNGQLPETYSCLLELNI